MKEIGFIEKKQKYFQHEDCPWFIEFVSPPVAVGNEPVYKFNTIKTPLGTIKLLRPADSIKDRLASFYHWNDKQGLEQALQIYTEQHVDLKEIEKWSILEEEINKFNEFKKLLKKL